MFFVGVLYIEFAVSTRIMGLGPGLRIHPMSTSFTLGLVIFRFTIGYTHRPRRSLGHMDISRLRRKDDGYVIRQKAG